MLEATQVEKFLNGKVELTFYQWEERFVEGDYQYKVWLDAGGWCWERIKKILGLSYGKKLRKIGGTLLDNAKFRIGDGSRVCFWNDL